MKRERLLIIEDDESLRWGLEHHFRKFGYEIESAPDGSSGLALARDEDGPDLILLDIMMPEKNGYEVCATLRKEGKTTPIIMLTAKGQEEDIIRGLELGADDYVTKPFSLKILHARVQAFLRRAATGPALEYPFGDFTLDTESHRLLRNEIEIELTSKEYGVLEFLLINQGKALTRDQILRAAWGSSLVVTSRSVDRCLTTLRSKIEPDPKCPTWIKTIRDVGYRFET